MDLIVLLSNRFADESFNAEAIMLPPLCSDTFILLEFSKSEIFTVCCDVPSDTFVVRLLFSLIIRPTN